MHRQHWREIMVKNGQAWNCFRYNTYSKFWLLARFLILKSIAPNQLIGPVKCQSRTNENRISLSMRGPFFASYSTYSQLPLLCGQSNGVSLIHRNEIEAVDRWLCGALQTFFSFVFFLSWIILTANCRLLVPFGDRVNIPIQHRETGFCPFI